MQLLEIPVDDPDVKQAINRLQSVTGLTRYRVLLVVGHVKLFLSDALLGNKHSDKDKFLAAVESSVYARNSSSYEARMKETATRAVQTGELPQVLRDVERIRKETPNEIPKDVDTNILIHCLLFSMAVSLGITELDKQKSSRRVTKGQLRAKQLQDLKRRAVKHRNL